MGAACDGDRRECDEARVDAAYDDCVEAGGTVEDCRVRAAGACDDGRETCDEAVAAYEACIEGGGGVEECPKKAAAACER